MNHRPRTLWQAPAVEVLAALRGAVAAGRPPADPWYQADPGHRTAWAYAPRPLHPDFIRTQPTTRAQIAALVAAGRPRGPR